MSELHVLHTYGFRPGDRIQLADDPTPYVVLDMRGDTRLVIEPVWWWRLWLAILSVFE